MEVEHVRVLWTMEPNLESYGLFEEVTMKVFCFVDQGWQDR